ncbi:MAG: hypothetical protein QOH92_820 [Chloroflexota bacterium]|jgi:uncharacterized protein YndB with AHSA1/START domain|nr:hypothetical protein [Chloroflexota bacterium]
MSEPAPEIRHSVFIRAPRAKVWAALTTAQAMDAWWGTRGSEIDLRPGGKLTLRWRGWGPERDINADRECVVAEVLPQKRFVFRWGETADTTTTVEFDLEDRDGGTLLRLREHGFAPTAKGRESFGGNSLGWGEVSILIKFYVEHGVRY